MDAIYLFHDDGSKGPYAPLRLFCNILCMKSPSLLTCASDPSFVFTSSQLNKRQATEWLNSIIECFHLAAMELRYMGVLSSVASGHIHSKGSDGSLPIPLSRRSTVLSFLIRHEQFNFFSSTFNGFLIHHKKLFIFKNWRTRHSCLCPSSGLCQMWTGLESFSTSKKIVLSNHTILYSQTSWMHSFMYLWPKKAFIY